MNPPLFGRPNEKTGLTESQCGPACQCEEDPWEAPMYGGSDVQKALGWALLDPPASLTHDPYSDPVPPEPAPDTVCGVLPEAPGSHNYSLVTYESEAGARAAGAFATHFGDCGLCSPLADLAVYMRENDLTAPVRQCGVDNFGASKADHMECLQALGFDYPCAEIWYYNTLHTRFVCLAQCIESFDAPYNLADGSLNECLACDEELSGPVFKAVAGRTRRNTGIPNAICRPCAEARRLVHDYL